MELDRDIKEDVKINRFQLERECEDHSSLYYYYAEQLAEARKTRDFLKDKLKSEQAKVEMQYRTSELTLDCKMTESSISSAVEINSGIQKIKQEFLQADYECNQLQAMEESMKQRKSMLDYLIQLYIREYYSDPTNRRDKYDQGSDEIRKNLNKK